MSEPSLDEVNKIICKLGSDSFLPVIRIELEFYCVQEESNNQVEDDTCNDKQNISRKRKRIKSEDSSTKFWLENYNELKDFKTKEGHCTPSYIKNPKLYSWLHRQKFQNRTHKLPKERIKLLQDLGVQFVYHWDEMYKELEQFKKQDIIAQIRTKKENAKLKDWLYSQLITWKGGKLSENRIYRMKQLGFIPDMKNQFK